MKRRAARPVMFLLLGAIANVAVAWGCRFVEPNYEGGHYAFGFGISEVWGRQPSVGVPLRSFEWSRYSCSPEDLVWPGFAINTIFYAGVLWMVFAFPFVMRRRRRIKRNLCPACAYPVGTSPVCAECGGVVTEARKVG